MKKLIFVVIIGFAYLGMSAQQDAQYTNFMFNRMAINPGYAGSKDVASITALYRNQWIGLDGAPKTQTVDFHFPFWKNKCGAGLILDHDQIGYMDKWRGSANYAYKLKLSKKTTFSIGLNASLLALRINTNKATTIESGDPTVPSMGSSKIFPNAGLGFYLKSTRWYLGASLPELIKNDFYSRENNGLGDLMIRQERHLFVMGGYTVKLSKMLKLIPNIQLKYIKNAPFDFDANLSLLIADKVTLGATYRLGDSADMLVHWNINDRIHAGVSYDFTLTKLQQVNKGSVEVMVGYDFYNSSSRLVNPRFF